MFLYFSSSPLIKILAMYKFPLNGYRMKIVSGLNNLLLCCDQNVTIFIKLDIREFLYYKKGLLPVLLILGEKLSEATRGVL